MLNRIFLAVHSGEPLWPMGVWLLLNSSYALLPETFFELRSCSEESLYLFLRFRNTRAVREVRGIWS